MPHLRWNPLLGTYTMVAANRQVRPHLPVEGCPFCPGSGKVPSAYLPFAYPNDFPALHNSFTGTDKSHPSYSHSFPALGACEVLLYYDAHSLTMSKMNTEQIAAIVNLWADRFHAFSRDENVKYIFEFENKGEEVGVTIHHPHGQLYAYPFLPLKLETELRNAKKYWTEKGSELFGDIIRDEKADGRRCIVENDSFLACIPYFTDYPYGVMILSKANEGNLTEMSTQTRKDLAEVLRIVTAGFDALFHKPFPYMMCLHQNPVNCEDYADWRQYFRFHIEFYPPLRTADRIKWMASSETGAWAAANTRLVEETAEELRAAISRAAI